MTINYCGRCGSSNGSSARFCRHCGVELTHQSPLATPSSPLNVEFSGKSARPTPPPPPLAPPYPGQANREQDAKTESDPVSISASLRRIRQSGPLIIEAVKEKHDRQNERQLRINEIITQASESVTKPSTDNLRDAPRDTGKLSGPTTRLNTNAAKSEPPANKPSAPSPRPTFAAQVSRRLLGPRTSKGSDALTQKQSTAPVVSSSEPALRPTPTATPARRPATTSSGPLAPRHSATALASSNALPSGGPSSVLAQASGLTKQTGWESKFRMGVIALAMLLAAGTYFVMRDRLLAPGIARDGERNLLRAEEQSAQLLSLGERERDQGNNDAALEHFQRALTLTPNNPEIKFLLAQTYASAGQPDDAVKTLQLLLRATPDHLEARLQLAELYRQRGNWNAAYQEYQRIIGLNQNSGQAAAALDAIEKHQAAQPGAPAPLVAVSNPQVRTPRKATTAAPVLPVGALAKTQIPLLQQRAVPVPAIKPPTILAAPRVEEKPDPRMVADNHKKLGVRYLNVREYRAAIQEFLLAVRLAPEDKDLYYFIGSSYHGLNQPAVAYEYYRRVDSGPYVGPAQSGARQTEKAARQEQKARDVLQNEARAASDANAPKTVINE